MTKSTSRALAPVTVPAQVGEYLSGPSLAQVSALATQAAQHTELERYQDRKAEQTLRRQRADIELFTRFLASTGVIVEDLHTRLEQWASIEHGLVQAFVAWQLREGYATGSINVRLATIKTYCKLASRAGSLPAQAFALIQTVEGYRQKEARNQDDKRVIAGTATRRDDAKKAEPTSINLVQATRLKQQPDTKKGRRDALLMCLLLEHGLRVSEIADLNISNFDVTQGTLTFYRHKVDLTQTLDLTQTPDTYKAALAYLADVSPASSEPEQEDRPLFTSKHKDAVKARIHTSTLNRRVEQLGLAIGLSCLSPHDCRHFWATDAVRNGTDIKSLQDAGGWSSPAMPLRYAERSKIANSGVKLSVARPL